MAQRRVSLTGQLGLDCDFVAFNDSGGHVTYEIKLTCQAKNKIWTIKKRYSDFHNLNNLLHADKNFRGVKLPNLPPKSISLTDASKRELTEKRMAQLQEYLRGIISRNVFLSSKGVIEFLEMPISVRELASVLLYRQNAPLKQGWMEKKGLINKKWKKRWFVLQPNYILKYYKAEDSTDPQGSIDISTIGHINPKDASDDKKHSFALKTRDRIWLLAAEDEQNRREWTRIFMRLKDTKVPPRRLNSSQEKNVNNTDGHNQRLSLNLGPHFRTITRVTWSPVIPGILATGSEDESVKIWNTHLLDHTLMPNEPHYEDDLLIDENKNENENENNDESNKDGDDQKNENNENNGNIKTPKTQPKKWQSTFPIHAVEFRPIAEYKTSGKVTSMEWSPDGLMLVVSLKKEYTRPDLDASNADVNYAYFIQCFDLSPILGGYTEEEDEDDEDNLEDGSSEQRTKIFTLQDHPSQLSFSNDGNNIYMSMDIDPNSEENEKRRPAFLVYLDLSQNQLHRCKTVDKIIDHQTEFIVGLAMNHNNSLMVVATSTHKGQGRIIAWDVEKNETRIVQRQGHRVTCIIWTEDDSWLIIGRQDGRLEFWSVYNPDNKKLTESIYKTMINNYNKTKQSITHDDNDKNKDSDKDKDKDDDKDGDNNNDNNSDDKDKDKDKDKDDTNADEVDDDDNFVDKSVEIDRPPNVAIFEQRYEETVHAGPVFNLTTSNGILISSAKPNNLEYESFFVDNCVWDARGLMNNGAEPKMISRLHNINDQENDITRLLSLSPVTPRHVREGGGPGTLLAASGHNHVYCHNMMDVILDSLTRPLD